MDTEDKQTTKHKIGFRVIKYRDGILFHKLEIS
jgi:hypothetical protein